MFKKSFKCYLKLKKYPRYITRSVTFRKLKAPGVKVQQFSYLKKAKIFNPVYSLPKKFRKPLRLAWLTLRGYIYVISFGYLKEPPAIEVEFPKATVPFSDLDKGEDKDRLL